jgi:uncharacterized transporter YbjL
MAKLILIGFVLTYGANLISHFDPGVSAGLMTGSHTTPAGLATALDVIRAGKVSLPPGFTKEQVLQNINVTYALAFLVADIAAILLCRSILGLFRFDLRAESFRKELGLLLFLAGVGISAGQGLPVIVTFLFGLHYLKMNPALLLGAVTGSVTCTPAMAAVSSDAKSSIPTIGYAGTYAFATVLCAIVGSIMARL